MGAVVQHIKDLVPTALKDRFRSRYRAMLRLPQVWKLCRRRRYYAAKKYDAERRRMLADLRGKERICVAFQVDTFAKWKADSLLQLMKAHPRFEPFIRYVPYCGIMDAAETLNRTLIQQYAAEVGVPCLEFESYEALPEGCRADVVFVSEPYDGGVYCAKENKGLTERAICYIPYGFFTIGTEKTMDQIINNAALFNLYENEATHRLAAGLMHNGGCNVAITGHTMADAFLYSEAVRKPVWKDCGKTLKKVIWAPHWTVSGANNWFASGNFTELASAMLKLAEKYSAEIQFAFKPHPKLFATLCGLPEWGEKKTTAYYRQWAEMPNTQLEEGAYTALFMQSDAMVHDSSSFIAEYMFADKPALFIRKGEGYQGYSPMAFEALKCYHKGVEPEEIEAFLQHCVLGGDDPYAEERRKFRRDYLIPPHGVSAAQNVVDCLLGQGAYAD